MLNSAVIWRNSRRSPRTAVALAGVIWANLSQNRRNGWPKGRGWWLIPKDSWTAVGSQVLQQALWGR